jgi:hypothetical protein
MPALLYYASLDCCFLRYLYCISDALTTLLLLYSSCFLLYYCNSDALTALQLHYSHAASALPVPRALLWPLWGALVLSDEAAAWFVKRSAGLSE